ncbi:MAG: hypothetical protein ACREYF_24305 [Gammaproteobacteria bacterium]
MEQDQASPHVPVPLGDVEPHAGLLRLPLDEQALYKITTVENLLRSIVGKYLHFNRVDSYPDFPGVDLNDGQQLPGDQPGNASARFQKAPEFSAADYYDQSRARTYACCFSLENSAHIWNTYGKDSAKGKACVVFSFRKLRARLNRTLQPGNAAVLYNGVECLQIFSVNYGIVEYVDWHAHRANAKFLPNPIEYTYLKDRQFSEEKELRVSLSALGMGHFALDDGAIMQFPLSLQLSFDFKAAMADGTIQQLLLSPDTDVDFLNGELQKLRIVAKEG